MIVQCLDELKSLDIEQNKPEKKEDDLNPTDDGEACEESHGASNKAQLGLHLGLLVSLDVVEGGCVKVDLNKLKS